MFSTCAATTATTDSTDDYLNNPYFESTVATGQSYINSSRQQARDILGSLTPSTTRDDTEFFVLFSDIFSKTKRYNFIHVYCD